MTTVIRLLGADEVALAAADLIQSSIEAGGRVLGLATGASPQATYTELAHRVVAGRLSLAECSAYLLDEYVGLGSGHPQNYGEVIRRDLVDHVDLPDTRVLGPDGDAGDLSAECRRYDKAVTEAHIDMQILGIGSNGHIGFNEPGSPLTSTTRVVSLTEQTRRDNARHFDVSTQVPRLVVTQGLATICRARRIVLVALGEHKAAAVAHAALGPVSSECPASVLQRHPDATILADSAAASRLP